MLTEKDHFVALPCAVVIVNYCTIFRMTLRNKKTPFTKKTFKIIQEALINVAFTHFTVKI